ncbi:Scavenger receptor cysteine-rich type 1 M130 [Paramuricea clavata]|uniref:Scavenger receptor cysteine-rich type 1 M130 n=1 Tax=Paramuricea clavata TaxID=317549 RepID=A0A6S7IU58_PARCT|nr:Scavenger receptor cysteine-rich type 1 M130 [Paramuricea clavata]
MYALADLQTKVKDTENEKNSLITTIKLVQIDQFKPSGTQNQVDTWHVVRNKKPNVSKDAHKTVAGIADVNRYEVLSDSDVEPTEGQRPPYVRPITTYKNPGNRESTFDKTLISDSSHQNSYSKSKTSEGPITVLGDSMIKMIRPPKLSRSIGEKVDIKTFPGATINDMNHYIQSTMKKQPKLVILYVGTNDIQRKEPDEIVAEMKSLC